MDRLLETLRNAIRCDLAYMEPTWMARDAQVFVEVVNGVQHLAVAGTNSLTDAFRDALLTWVERDSLGYVRNGFADSWDALRDALPIDLNLAPELPVRLRAHSLGAPIAQYMVPVLQARGFRVLDGEDFGSPTGWKAPITTWPRIPWTHWKNGYDPVAMRPWRNLLPWRPSKGCCPGEWKQIHKGAVRPKVFSPAASLVHLLQMNDNHRLNDPRGYIQNFGAACDREAAARGIVFSWRDLPEARRWAAAVVAFEDRGRQPLLRAA